MQHPYGETILDHFRRPRNQGVLPGATITQEGTNPLCGDRVRIQILLDGELVRDARFTANACAVCVASASMLTGLVQHAPLEEVETLTVEDLLRALQARLPAARLGCLSLPLTVMHTGVMLYRQAHPPAT